MTSPATRHSNPERCRAGTRLRLKHRPGPLRRRQDFRRLSIMHPKRKPLTRRKSGCWRSWPNDLAYRIITLRARVEHEQACNDPAAELEQSIQTIAGTVGSAPISILHGHQRRVAELAVAIAREMGLPEEQNQWHPSCRHNSRLGKIHIPAEILSKPGKLSDIEYLFIKTHPQAGYDILKDVEISLADCGHHPSASRKTGWFGYPQGLKDEQILLESRNHCVADVVEAMLSHRPYRPALGSEATMNEIKRGPCTARMTQWLSILFKYPCG